MILLLQLIVYLNLSKTPEVNLVTNFSTIKECKKKLMETHNRNISGGNNSSLLKDDINNFYLKITTDDKNVISYWFCKETIFFKNSSKS